MGHHKATQADGEPMDKKQKKRKELDVGLEPRADKKVKKAKRKSGTVETEEVIETPQPTVPGGKNAKGAGKDPEPGENKTSPPGDDKPNTDGKKAPKSTPTQVRIDDEGKKALADSDRAMFIALPKSWKKGQNAAFHAIRGYVTTELKLEGVCGMQPNGVNFWAVLFKNTKQRDSAVVKIHRKPMEFNGVKAKLVAFKFGDPRDITTSIWTIITGLIPTAQDVCDAIVAHFADLELEYSSAFGVRAKLVREIADGTWVVKFDDPPPNSAFKKQMVVGGMKSYVSVEPPNHCRFCSNSGHTILDCTTPGHDKSVGEEIRGAVKGGSNLGDEDMEEGDVES